MRYVENVRKSHHLLPHHTRRPCTHTLVQTFTAALPYVWPMLLYYVLTVVGTATMVVRILSQDIKSPEHISQLELTNLLLGLVAVAWALLTCIYLWPPLGALLPRKLKQLGDLSRHVPMLRPIPRPPSTPFDLVWRVASALKQDEDSMHVVQQQQKQPACKDGDSLFLIAQQPEVQLADSKKECLVMKAIPVPQEHTTSPALSNAAFLSGELWSFTTNRTDSAMHSQAAGVADTLAKAAGMSAAMEAERLVASGSCHNSPDKQTSSVRVDLRPDFTK
jgi:hypothetical protein